MNRLARKTYIKVSIELLKIRADRVYSFDQQVPFRGKTCSNFFNATWIYSRPTYLMKKLPNSLHATGSLRSKSWYTQSTYLEVSKLNGMWIVRQLIRGLLQGLRGFFFPMGSNDFGSGFSSCFCFSGHGSLQLLRKPRIFSAKSTHNGRKLLWLLSSHQSPSTYDDYLQGEWLFCWFGESLG